METTERIGNGRRQRSMDHEGGLTTGETNKLPEKHKNTVTFSTKSNFFLFCLASVILTAFHLSASKEQKERKV
jgi:hypothetical protein